MSISLIILIYLSSFVLSLVLTFPFLNSSMIFFLFLISQ
jgi:hypothetical protein